MRKSEVDPLHPDKNPMQLMSYTGECADWPWWSLFWLNNIHDIQQAQIYRGTPFGISKARAIPTRQAKDPCTSLVAVPYKSA